MKAAVQEGPVSSHQIVLMGCALLLTAASSAAGQERPGDAWQDFNRRVAVSCPAKKLESRPAGDVNDLQENFYATLSPKEIHAFLTAIPRVDDGPRPCAKRDGISCPTAWNMVALKKVGLLPRFVDYACASAGDMR